MTHLDKGLYSGNLHLNLLNLHLFPRLTNHRNSTHLLVFFCVQTSEMSGKVFARRFNVFHTTLSDLASRLKYNLYKIRSKLDLSVYGNLPSHLEWSDV